MRKIVVLGLGAAMTAGSLGVSAGIATSATPSAHVAWCEQTYRSYNPGTDSFVGNDGYSHPCVAPDATRGQQTLGSTAPGGFVTVTPAQQNLPGNRYSVFPGENDPNYGANQNN